ncbi:hypothetical protein ABEB36_006280 [Hypothenemus hampei]|uniref:HEAT repeat-containing protein 1 n=1 Tax=Hypothenemus hampei TaxID=57062 RepID=A0ABD1ETX9_HYPHA
MSTSLSEQLRQLATPSTNVFKEDKKRPTFLFDPKEAASINGEVIYEIGLDGLEQLIQKDEKFSVFRLSLFNNSSIDFDRNVHGKEDNEKLDKHIRKFLITLSPYVLTNAAHKALEWLFYRYRINEFNRNDLIITSLPFYNSNIFTRIVQTCKFNETSDLFNFLRDTQKSNLPLQRLSLYYQIYRNGKLVKYITKFMKDLTKTHQKQLLTVHFNFYCTTFCGALEMTDKAVEESFISNALPLLLQGLTSSIADFTSASYVIIARLLSKISLTEKLLDTIVEKVVIGLKTESIQLEASFLLLLIYQLQSHYKKLPLEALEYLKMGDWINCLEYLHERNNCIYPLLEVILENIILQAFDGDTKSRDLIMGVLDKIQFDAYFINKFLSMFLDSLNKEVLSDNQWFYEVIAKLHSKYQSTFQDTFNEVFKIPQRKKYYSAILERGNKSKLDIFNKLYTGKGGIDPVISTEIQNGLKSADSYLFMSKLTECLHSDDPRIVERTLKLLETLEFSGIEFFDTGRLFAKKYRQCCDLAIELFVKENSFNWKMFVKVFPYIVLNYRNFFEKVSRLLHMKFFRESSVFKTLNLTKYQSDSSDFLQDFLTHLKENTGETELEQFLTYIQLDFPSNYLTLYCIITILSRIVSNNLNEQQFNIIFALFNQISNKVSNNESNTEEGYMEMAIREKMPMKSVKEHLRTIIGKLISKHSNWLFLDCHQYPVLTHLINLKFANSNFDDIFNVLLEEIHDNSNGKLTVALNICSSQILTGKTFTKLLKFVEESIVPEAESVSKLDWFYVLSLLAHSTKEIRKLAFKMIEQLLIKVNSVEDFYTKFLKQLLLRKEEISSDPEQFPAIAFNLLKTNNRELLTELLDVTCSDQVPVYVKSATLSMLSQINSFSMVDRLCAHFHKQLHVDILTNIVNRLNDQVVQKLSITSNVWKFLVFALNSSQVVTINAEQIYVPCLVLRQLSKNVCMLLYDDVLEALLGLVCQLSVTLEDPELIALSGKIFKHIDLDARLICPLLSDMIQVNHKKSGKGQRISMPTVDTTLDALEWKKGVVLLEFLQNKKKIRNAHYLIPLLFDILKKCLDFEEQAVVEYPKQLTLALILLVCAKLEDDKIYKKDFNIELVIQCIRASQNPQTHYHALLALAHASRVVPDEVLRHVMAVFTFVGSTLVRHDDAYSFDVISKIIDTIIPILVGQDQTLTIRDVLRVFVDALLDIPEHRTVMLYTKLLNHLDAKRNLCLFLTYVLDAEVFQTSREKKKVEKGRFSGNNKSRRINIALQLCNEFTLETLLHACVQMTKYVNELPDDLEDRPASGSDTNPVNLNRYTPKQFRHFKYLIINFLSNLLSSRELLAKLSPSNEENSANNEASYKELIINVLAYVQRVQKVCEKSRNSPQLVYWRTLLHNGHDLLDGVNDLLSPKMFLLVVRGLLAHSMVMVKKRALELLNTKLQNNRVIFNDPDIFSLINPIFSIIETCRQNDVSPEQEALIQTALLSLKLIVKVWGPTDPEKFVKPLEFVSNFMNVEKLHGNVLASVILCVTEMGVVLRGHALASLPHFMPAFLAIVKKQKHQETSGPLLLSVVTAINRVIESFAPFLSPYLPKLLNESAILISKWGQSQQSQLTAKLIGIKKKIASAVPARLLIPIIDDCYDNLMKKSYFNALVCLVAILEEQLVGMQSSEVAGHITELSNFFLKALDFRKGSSTHDMDEVYLVESQVVKTLTSFTLKLSESSFRPFYLKLFDWAVRSGNSERLITFYHLSYSIGQSLRGLFVLFSRSILNNVSEILKNIASGYFEDENKKILLLEFVLKTLQVIFTYDNNKTFNNRERFQLLMEHLVNLLDTNLDGLEALMKRNENLITPTIVLFVQAVGDDGLWKEINYQILLKMRNSTVEIRLIALHCVLEMVLKLKENFMPLLPETIPFLAELLEDDDERVEKMCQTAIREMEKVLGEPLQKYF